MEDVIKLLLSEHAILENAPIKESKPSKVETPQDKDAWRKDPNRKLDHYGMIYCYTDGIWVFRSKCDSCKNWNCEVKKKKQEEKP